MDTGEPLSFDAVPVPHAADNRLAVELSPAPDPWAVARTLAHLPHLLFLDSAEYHPDRGRYSYVAADPTHLETDFDRLRTASAAETRAAALPGLPPFQGGWAGLFGYDLAHRFEQLPRARYDEFRTPALAVGRYEWVVAFDHSARRAWLVASGPRAGAHFRSVLDHLRSRPGTAPADAEPPVPASHLAPQFPLAGFDNVTSNFDRGGYEAGVRRAVEYVHAGDCFQVNLSQRLLAPLREHPLALYARLRKRNPAPFGAYFDLGAFQILSASPERFLRLSASGEVETRPIKGTRRRGTTPAEDAALIHDLATSSKDRAENVMIVDLLRNDIGKACEFGSVRVPRVCEIETFRFVHHMVSEVRGRLRPGVGPFDLLAGAFPGGSVTGAPKVRAMEVIAELEPTARGPYCGCLGWVGFDGAMDTNILIRTFTAGRGWVQFPVGGGIVADSDPAREYEETLHKAAGLLRALDAGVSGIPVIS